MLKITREDTEKKKNSIINVVLIVISVIVLFFCLSSILKNNEVNTKDVVLVKDMSEGNEGRIISNKTDILAVGEKEINLKVEKPDGYITPEEFYNNQENEFGTNVQKSDNKSNIILKGPNILSNDVVGEPLKLPEPDEIIRVIDEEVIVDNPEERNRLLREYYEELRNRRAQRNPGRESFLHGAALEGGNVNSVSFDKLYENGCIIIPFKLDDEVYMNNLTLWNDIYNEYKDKITFIFLNLSYNKEEILVDIKNSFIERGLNELPFYYDLGPNFITLPIINNSSYLMLNCDNYIYASNGKDMVLNKESIETEIDNMLVEIESFKKVDARLNEDVGQNEDVG